MNYLVHIECGNNSESYIRKSTQNCLFSSQKMDDGNMRSFSRILQLPVPLTKHRVTQAHNVKWWYILVCYLP
jgi:hypothetical protein